MGTREKLIESTAKFIHEKGYYATGINEVLNDAGIAKGSLYHHFPNGKDELVLISLMHAAELRAQTYKSAMKGKGSAENGLKGVIDVHITELRDTNYSRGCPLATVSLEISSENETLRKACADLFEFWIHELEKYLMYKGVDAARRKAEFFMTGLEGAILLSKVQRDSRYLAQFKDQIKSLLK